MSDPGGDAGRDRKLAPLAVLAASVAFGTTGTAQAKGPDGTTPLGVGTMRIVVGAVALIAAVAVIRRRRGPSLRCVPTGGEWWWVVVGGLGVALYQPMFFAGTERGGVALGTIIALGSGPMFVGVYEALVLRHRPSGTWVIATALALAGGAVLVVSQDAGAGGADAVGVLCSVGAGFGYATFAVVAQGLILDRAGAGAVDSSVAMSWIFAAGALFLSPALFVEPLGWVTTRAGVVMVAHLGIVTVAVAYLLYGYGLRSIPTSTATTITLAEPVTAALAGAVVLDERLTFAGWCGAGLVVAGLALTGLRRPAPQSALT